MPVEYVILANPVVKPSKLFYHSCYLIVINLFSQLFTSSLSYGTIGFISLYIYLRKNPVLFVITFVPLSRNFN